MKLYSYYRSSSSWRVRIALHFKELEFEYVPVNISPGASEQLAPGFEELNPLHQVPVLQVDEAGASLSLTQSMAILEYLEERFTRFPLLPASRRDRARAREIAEMVNSAIQPLQNLRILGDVEQLAGESARSQWAERVIERGLTALERLLGDTKGRYAVGDTVTLADVLIVPQLYNARRYGIDVERFPLLVAVERASSELVSFRESHPDCQPDAPR